MLPSAYQYSLTVEATERSDTNTGPCNCKATLYHLAMPSPQEARKFEIRSKSSNAANGLIMVKLCLEFIYEHLFLKGLVTYLKDETFLVRACN